MKNLPPMPPELAQRPRDRRGLPIPFIAVVKPDGVPDYTVNDVDRVEECAERGLCALSGLPMGRDDVWFIGGPKAAYHPAGAFLDPPGKRVCLEWAAQVCPFIALTKFEGFKRGAPVIEGATTILNPHSETDRPPYFVLARCDGYHFEAEDLVHFPNRPWREAQHWREGERYAVLTRAQTAAEMERERIVFKRENPGVVLPSWQRRFNRGAMSGSFPWQRSQ